MNFRQFLILILSSVLLLAGCRKQPAHDQLVIFHAGSLSVPFAALADIFEQQNPGIKVTAESAGSRLCARKVTELNQRCDILASADYKVISNLVMPDHARFNIQFALNEMVIAYTDKSRYADSIDQKNWPETLLRTDVNIGRSDPDSDPCGYRTLMTIQLAEKHFNKDGLYSALSAKDNYIRPKETDLLALLQAGEIDYIFIYRSVAKQHGLKILFLPDEINLKSSQLSDLYSTASVTLTGTSPGEYIVRLGEPMIYSMTIPTTAENRPAAEKFIELVLSDQGRAIMEANGQPTLAPPIAEGFANLPGNLKNICQPAPESR